MRNEVIRKKHKRYKFSPIREKVQIERLIGTLPEDEVIKVLTVGGFSSLGFIIFIAEHTMINELTVSTLRVGKKHLHILDKLHKSGKLKRVNFIVGSIMKKSGAVDKFGYYDDLIAVCKENNWQVRVENNHSKLLLFDTKDGKYVIETSSNLNENPKIEQFSFEKSAELFDFYHKFFLAD